MPLVQKEFTSIPAHPAIGATPVELTEPRENQWYSIGPQIWKLLLNGDPNSHEKSVLQWYEPKAKSAMDEVITHTYIEEVCFMEGGLKDITLGQAWSQGAYAYRLPRMKHGPYEASPEGCLMFVKIVPASEISD